MSCQVSWPTAFRLSGRLNVIQPMGPSFSSRRIGASLMDVLPMVRCGVPAHDPPASRTRTRVTEAFAGYPGRILGMLGGVDAPPHRAPRLPSRRLSPLLLGSARGADGHVDADGRPVVAGAPAHAVAVQARADRLAPVRADPALLHRLGRARLEPAGCSREAANATVAAQVAHGEQPDQEEGGS